jgi:putative ABC transport system substrate-binding protein
MKRRHFIALVGGAAVAQPMTAFAQAALARVAFLGSGTAEGSAILLAAFREGLRDNGLLEGQNCEIEMRWADSHYERFPALVGELQQRNPQVMIVTTIAAGLAAQRVAPAVPLVMTGFINPVGAGLITSLSRPSGNTTGLANLTEDFSPKLVEILRTIVPAARVLAALFNPANPQNKPLLDQTRSQAEPIGVTIQPAPFRTPDELDVTFAELAQKRPDGLLIISDITFVDLRERIAQLALQYRLPSIAPIAEFTETGGLAAYGPSRRVIYRRAAWYVKRILDGTKPADLPVEQPTQIELSINLATAKVLGITITDAVLSRADRVIE